MSILSHTNTVHPPILVSRSILILFSYPRLGLCVYPQPHKHRSPTYPSLTIHFNIIFPSTPRAVSILSHTNTVHPPILVSRSILILSSYLRLGLCVYPQPHKHRSPTHLSLTIQFNFILPCPPRSTKLSFLKVSR